MAYGSRKSAGTPFEVEDGNVSMGEDSGAHTAADRLLAMRSRNIGYLLRDTHRSFRRIMKDRIERHGITVAMWTQLWELWQEDGLTQSELARRLKLEKPSVNSTVVKMETRGLVERQTTESDRRERRVFLTPKAWEMQSDLADMASEINEEVLAGLKDEEVAKVMGLLRRVNETARQIADDIP